MRTDLGAVKLDLRPYRLRFKRPFGTAHGLRDGTDTVLLRVSYDGFSGFGEATTPPYVKESQRSIIGTYKSIDIQDIDANDLKSLTRSLDRLFAGRSAPAARAGLQMALMDLMMKRMNVPASTMLSAEGTTQGKAAYTLGISTLSELESKLSEVTQVPVLKVKLQGTEMDLQVLRWVAARTDAALLLDANQGLSTVAQALQAIQAAGGPGRVVGMEQPFHQDDLEAHAALARGTAVPVIADESVQGPEDLEKRGWAFGGVNLKLMKCGGLDKAAEMAARARAMGKLVMLGSMSESSLGCAAMAALGRQAAWCDLDGPWLIANDPFTGFTLRDGCYESTGGSGFGVEPVQGLFENPFGT
ncbi:MAG: L-Ala-D/L-Glu epimerase [Flavobacteriales bacterium]|nr:L-Ala-D/L-Glu epimerase [Flavobacteriales bacterium]